MTHGRLKSALAITCAALGLVAAQPAFAQQRSFDVPAQDARKSIPEFARQAGIQISAPTGRLKGVRTKTIKGNLDARAALRTLIQGTGLSIVSDDGSMIVLRYGEETSANEVPETAQETQAASSSGKEDAPTESAAANDASIEILVTGTRIRGGRTPSPVISISSEQIREEGFTDLGQVIRSIPQNFRGGQNPGVIGASGGGASSKDLTGGSALNLRGLGADASLTLLNGRRLAYDGFSQAVDVSAIPVEAVERLEIVPDGASAIYGSDAVGGVANVILKRDFDGVTVGGRIGAATDGGLDTREYSITAGTTWSSGGLIATYKNGSVDPIYARQRSYTNHLVEPYTIYYGWDSRNGLVSFHQSAGNVAELRIDTLMTDRETVKYFAQPGSYERNISEASVFLISPSIEFLLPHDWSLTIGGTYGKNEYAEERYLGPATGSSLASNTDIYNKSHSVEVGAEGPLFAVGGGDARLAVGLGSRTDEYLQVNRITDVEIGGDERARYAYAELYLPLVQPSSDIAGIHRLEFTAAIRAEDYDSFGRVATPKLGAIYAPSADVSLKASWGKSFKAPTLNQRYLDKTAYLWTASATGGNGYPPGATVLMSYGGNLDLQAERARTWTASLAVHPKALRGFAVELTAFDIDYTDRVVEPVNFRLALSNPSYAEYVDYSPTPEQQAELLADYNSAFYNLSGAAYNPNGVVAIIRDQFINAALQKVKGVDLSSSYDIDLDGGRFTVRGSASWLWSTQQTTSDQPKYDLAGTVFNPAKFNSRVGAVWESGGFSASGFVNYTSGVTIKSQTITEKTGSFTTIDTTLNYDTGKRAGALSGFTIGLSIQNLLNREPPLYTPPSANFVPYDATNYSAIGRFVSVSVSKHW